MFRKRIKLILAMPIVLIYLTPAPLYAHALTCVEAVSQPVTLAEQIKSTKNDLIILSQKVNDLRTNRQKELIDDVQHLVNEVESANRQFTMHGEDDSDTPIDRSLLTRDLNQCMFRVLAAYNAKGPIKIFPPRVVASSPDDLSSEAWLIPFIQLNVTLKPGQYLSIEPNDSDPDHMASLNGATIYNADNTVVGQVHNNKFVPVK